MGLLKGEKGLTDGFYGFIKSRKRSIFVIANDINDGAFTAVKVLNKECERRNHLSIEGIRKGYLFRDKWYIKG